MTKNEKVQHSGERKIPIQRVQTGARMEKKMVKVLKALAEYHDISFGDLLEAIVLYAFEGKSPFDESARQRVAKLKAVYGMDYGMDAKHQFTELNEYEE